MNAQSTKSEQTFTVHGIFRKMVAPATPSRICAATRDTSTNYQFEEF